MGQWNYCLAEDDWEGPIMAELRQIRRQIMERFDNDFSAYLRYLKKKQRENMRQGIRYIAAPARRPRGRTPVRHRLRYAVIPGGVRSLPAGRGRGR